MLQAFASDRCAACWGYDSYTGSRHGCQFTPGTGTFLMIKRSSQVLCVWFLFWDIVLTASAWVGAYYLRFLSGWIPVYKPSLDISLCWRNLPLVMVLSVV